MNVITTLPIQIHPQGQPIIDSFSLRLPSQVILDCVKITTKTDHHRGGPGYQDEEDVVMKYSEKTELRGESLFDFQFRVTV